MCLLREDVFERQGLIEYNFHCFREAIQEVRQRRRDREGGKGRRGGIEEGRGEGEERGERGGREGRGGEGRMRREGGERRNEGRRGGTPPILCVYLFLSRYLS